MNNISTCILCKQGLSENDFVICPQCRSNYGLSDDENSFVDLFLKNSFSEYSPNNRAICMSSSAEVVIGKARKILNDIIIKIFKNSTQPLDILAVALTYARMYAHERPLAIMYFEKYLANPIQPPKIFHLAYEEHSFINGRITYSQWSIYSIFANVYEKEHEFEKAIFCLEHCINSSNEINLSDYIRIGNILVKMDINNAEKYYWNLLGNPEFLQYKEQLTEALQNVVEKKNRGYVFKARRKK